MSDYRNAPKILVSMRHTLLGTFQASVATPQAYLDLVFEGGGLPLCAPIYRPPSSGTTVEELIDIMLDEFKPDGILLIGGEDIDPANYGHQPEPELGTVDTVRDAYDLALTRAAQDRNLGIFGICRGLQTLNVASGGTLRQHILNHNLLTDGKPDPNRKHKVRLVPASRLADAIGMTEFDTNSYHHQRVDVVGTGLYISGRAEDGTPEVIEHVGDDRVYYGVQWHPEINPDPVSKCIMRHFIDRLRVRKKS